MSVYLNEAKELFLFKEFPFLLGFLPRGVSGMVTVYDFRFARHDKTVVYGITNEVGEWEEEEVSDFEAMKKDVANLCKHLDSDAIYDGIVDGIEITVFSEIEEEQGEQVFYKFYFVIKYAEVEKPIVAMEDDLAKQFKHFKPIILSYLRGEIDVQLSYHKNRLHVKGVDVWDVT